MGDFLSSEEVDALLASVMEPSLTIFPDGAPWRPRQVQWGVAPSLDLAHEDMTKRWAKRSPQLLGYPMKMEFFPSKTETWKELSVNSMHSSVYVPLLQHGKPCGGVVVEPRLLSMWKSCGFGASSAWTLPLQDAWTELDFWVLGQVLEGLLCVHTDALSTLLPQLWMEWGTPKTLQEWSTQMTPHERIVTSRLQMEWEGQYGEMIWIYAHEMFEELPSGNVVFQNREGPFPNLKNKRLPLPVYLDGAVEAFPHEIQKGTIFVDTFNEGIFRMPKKEHKKMKKSAKKLYGSAWDQLHFQLKVQAGTVSMTLKELKKLNAGAMIPLEGNEEAPWELLLNGQVVAEVEPVQINGQLGIQVLKPV